MQTKCKCLFNHELLIIATAKSPYQSYDADISDAQVRGFIEELSGTDVDTIMCCPTAWRCNLWRSEVDRHWQDEAPYLKEPPVEHDYKYYEKAYFRIRRYMLKGSDPVGLSLQTAHKTGKNFFISYRMNDHHFLDVPDAPMHNTFWRSHPEYCFAPDGKGQGYFDYAIPAVRDYYFDILAELANRYDIDGMELDFMRTPTFITDPAAGLAIMTGFVRRIKTMLDDLSAQRNKQLPLCVRLPQRFQQCAKAGLDVVLWARERLIDMANISPFYINELDLELETYKQHLPNVRIYGEMHFIVDSGEMPGGYTNNVTRKTSCEMYYAMAESYLARGADGLSLFNFDYVRHHSFNEPRRKGLADCEPPFACLKGITDREQLAGKAKHYYWRAESIVFPAPDRAVVQAYIHDPTAYGYAILRVVTKDSFADLKISARCNDLRLEETMWCGELFPPLSLEALHAINQMHFYVLRLPMVKPGFNTLDLISESGRRLSLRCMDLALYRDRPFSAEPA